MASRVLFQHLRCTSRNLTTGLCARAFASASSANVSRTQFYDYHVSQGGKMVDFAGWSMPVVYNDQSIIQSHLHTRQYASIFDVSHMMQTKIYGRDRVKFIEGLVVGDITGLSADTGTLTVFTNNNGGIIDDLIVSNTSHDYLYVVSNAGCRDGDLKHMQGHIKKCKSEGMDVELELLTDSLIALQGPVMSKALQSGLNESLEKLLFMNTVECSVFGVDKCRITRCGYTGEDGVEISIPNGGEMQVIESLMKNNEVKLAGLGARDSLRLEAGLCLYGSDIDANTTPVQATLAWLIGKRRRELADFPGADKILTELKNKPNIKRVGFISTSGPPARGGSEILNEDGDKIGHITSGCPSQSLKQNVSMGYIATSYSKVGTSVQLQIRNKLYNAVVSKMPFVPANYYFGRK